ncbi:(2Fe-2S)-binding protein [Thermomicrobiaceae bacterium CFH 74404]|uniref:(2Fe-2S)-binding protein n=1 Tax=Thermalbibacter longus TaxID=2951981 RepID=A0AA41WGF5_9BACT|nr:2Fe-2S iron-sulfur cluster-binding protein [Thermalbibacter longus]MCM8749935.1 (2Fe-2S)-binding protein [Thermalbibacter longus]
MEQTITVELNGERRALTVRTDATLLEVLRDGCGLASVRETCGIGICGACTVLVDGVPISSCLLLAPLADGCRITTVEGLSRGDELHPVQRAFIDQMAFQCSYCTPGMVLSAVALLAERPDPSPEEIAEYLAGNLCRCGSYPRILAAISDAARLMRQASR